MLIQKIYDVHYLTIIYLSGSIEWADSRKKLVKVHALLIAILEYSGYISSIIICDKA